MLTSKAPALKSRFVSVGVPYPAGSVSGVLQTIAVQMPPPIVYGADTVQAAENSSFSL